MADWMPPLPEPDIPSTPIYYAVSPVTSHGPGPMYPPMWGAAKMRARDAEVARAALEQAIQACEAEYSIEGVAQRCAAAIREKLRGIE